MDNAFFTPSQRDTTRPSTRSDARPFPTLASQDGAPSICRICRGEATVSEPLFYPCKCSGSIKYVHQECLMEWLSHSQKKHCELCKTSFRFTKLYAPDMPQSLPFHVFLEHMTKWLFRNVLVWLRALLTISIWMGWLPYFMRTVWSFVFWVSDEGLGGSQIMPRQKAIENEPLLLSISMASGQCPVTPLQPKTMTTIKEVDSMMKILSNNKFPDYFVKLILGSLGMPLEVNSTDLPKGWLSASNITTVLGGSNIRNMSTLLSDVPILRNLTRSPAVNRVVVSIIEGQIITVLVIIAFILVILVRDYVIQQQPEINMRAAFAAPEQQEQQQPQQPQQPQQEEPPNQEEAELPLPDDHEQGHDQQDHPEQLPLQPPRRPNFNFNFNDAPAQNQPQAREDTGPRLRGEPELDAFGAPSGDAGDNSLNPPAERQETVAEIQFGMREYLRMYKEARGDPYTILQMIADEGLEDRMQYWVDMTEGMIRREEEISDSDGGYEPEDVVRTVEIEAVRQAYDKKRRRAIFGNVNGESSTARGTSRDVSDQDIPDIEALFDGIPLPPNHGLFESSSSRPRAASAGSANRQGSHPLANNTWTFADLPPPQSSRDNQHAENDSDGHDDHVQNTQMASSVSHGSWSDSNTRFTDDNGQGSERGDRVEMDIPPPTQVGQQAGNPTGEAVTTPIAVEAVAPPDGNAEGGVLARLADFMWGDVDQAVLLGGPVIDEADEQWVDLPVAGGAVDEEPDPEANEQDDDEGEAAAAAAAGFDQEAIEDMEDFEGVMELIGMRGPIAGLFQNAIFCVVLVSVTILACIFIPYNIGRVTVWGMANPGRMMRMIVEFAKLIQDIVILFGGVASWFAINVLEMIMSPINGSLANSLVALRKMVWSIWTHAGARVFEYRIFEPPMTATEMQSFSAISHAALIIVKANVRGVFAAIGRVLASIYHSETSIISIASLKALPAVARNVATFFSTYSHVLLNPNSWVIDLGETERMAPVDPDLVNWSGIDRFWAIIAGYGTLFTAGALYLKRDMPFSTGDVMRAWEAGVIDSLHQASGIMKVIIIISIEMLVFPLYCGLLLDIALLPLFGSATVASRVMFTYQYPLTSAFVHWFVGTGYMFHFALFVSMCRKIMRSGVLYFIRDPDDPEFHPIRDVLDRNLTTQLRKILFSAFVYGALVIVCLGGVVWGLRYTLPNVLPIHYSSNEPVLEFPVDLLFYNFLMPLAVKFFKPSDGIHAMYTWWFRKCARGLRLTFFLFGQRKIDEEGVLQLPADSPHEPTFYNRHFLELDERNRVIPKTWKDTFDDGGPKPTAPLSKMERRTLKLRKSYLVSSGQLIKDGMFVRAPASDRIKIPKGQKIFLAVSEGNKRKDELEDNDMYGSEQYQYVYIPPNFRTRILSFILFIWLFAAITGVGFTIVPLIFGRMIFKMMIPDYVRTNDIYAFSIGVYLLGSAVYAVIHMQRLWGQAKDWLRQAATVAMSTDSVKRAVSLGLQGLKLVYTYLFLVVVFPLLVAAFMELYVAIPLHTYMNPPTGASMDSTDGMDGQTGRHSVRVIQAWVLGLLYLKLGSKMLTTTWPESRPSIAMQLVLRRGWADPDVSIFTRGFVLPGLVMSLFAIAGPPLATNVLIKNNLIGQALVEATEAETAARMAIIYRYSYPVAASCAAVIRYALVLVNVFNGWTAGIRDEAYLIGERLHNFGAATAGARKTGQAWRAGGTRL